MRDNQKLKQKKRLLKEIIIDLVKRFKRLDIINKETKEDINVDMIISPDIKK